MVAKVADLSGAGSVKRGNQTTNTQFARGGSGHMFGEQQASSQTPGQTEKNGATGKGAQFAAGGSTKMHGFAGSQSAQAGITSAR